MRLYGTGAGEGTGGFMGALEKWFGTEGHDAPREAAPLKPGEVAAEEAVELVTVPSLVLVATHAIEDEEVLLNYRLSPHVPRPAWYHPVDAQEEHRRWA